jgi:hypothetical protein
MMNAAAAAAENDGVDLNADTDFSDIKFDEVTPWNHVYCPEANQNFRAGESVELRLPVRIPGTNYNSQVGAILQVNQQCNPQRLLLSLFLDVTPDMRIKHNPPDNQVYVQYPSQQLVWTRYRGWYPVTLIRREAYVISPWEVSDGSNNTHVSIGMTNAYCVVAKWRHDVLHPTRAFQPITNEKIVVPGCLHSALTFESVTQRYWFFRSTLAMQIANVLSKASLAASTKGTFQVLTITPSHWDHFKRWTIPLEETERMGRVTTRCIRKNLTVEMVKSETPKQFARFDTAPRLDLLKAYLGSGIQGAGRIRRFAGPKLSRTGPVPAFRARRLLNGHSVGIIAELPNEPTLRRYSTEPGIDLMYCKAKGQLKIYIRYLIRPAQNPLVLQQLLGFPPADPQQDPPQQQVPGVLPVLLLAVDETEFLLDDTLYIVRDFTDDGDNVVCEVLESNDDSLNEEDRVTLPVDVVQEVATAYYS